MARAPANSLRSYLQKSGAIQRDPADTQPRQVKTFVPKGYEAVDPEERRKQYSGRLAQYIPKELYSAANEGTIEQRANLARRESLLKGYSAPELAAMQAQMAGSQQAAETQRNRALQAALAKQGIRGGAAAALQAQTAQLAAREKSQLAQDLFLRGEQRKREALGEYEQSVKSQFDIGQSRQALALSTQLAGEQLTSAEKIAAQQKAASDYYADKMIQAQREAASKGGCCFIFIEAGNGELDRIARRARDEMMTDRNKRGYYKLSEVFVPLMRKYPSFKFAIQWTMVKPMISFGKWKYGENKIGRIFKPIADFWFNTFDYLGSDHPFKRENGEII